MGGDQKSDVSIEARPALRPEGTGNPDAARKQKRGKSKDDLIREKTGRLSGGSGERRGDKSIEGKQGGAGVTENQEGRRWEGKSKKKEKGSKKSQQRMSMGGRNRKHGTILRVKGVYQTSGP